MFYADLWKLENEAFYCAISSVLVLQLGLVYNFSTILFDIYSRKFIYVDEIFKVSVLTFFTAFLNIFVDEFAFVPFAQLYQAFKDGTNSKGSSNSRNSKNSRDPDSYTVYKDVDPSTNSSNLKSPTSVATKNSVDSDLSTVYKDGNSSAAYYLLKEKTINTVSNTSLTEEAPISSTSAIK